MSWEDKLRPTRREEPHDPYSVVMVLLLFFACLLALQVPQVMQWHVDHLPRCAPVVPK